MPDGDIPSDAEYNEPFHNNPIPDADDINTTPSQIDSLVGSRIQVERGGDLITGTVTKRLKDNEGKPVGKYHPTSLFDTREYNVEFDDRTFDTFNANTISENIYAQTDSEGIQHSLFQEIVDHKRSTDALTPSQGFDISSNGNQTPKRTTKGWKLAVQWFDGVISWVSLKELKNSNPIELAEYAVAQRIDHEPAFNWWVKDTLRRRNRVIAKVKKKYWRTTQKFGIRLPHSVKEALHFDADMGPNCTLWRDTIEKELKKVRIACERRDDISVQDARQGRAFKGYKEITVHMVFDIKMDFTRKARLVAGGHVTDAPASVTYSSVVTRDSVRLALMLADLNELEVLAGDVGNAYLNAPCRERIWFRGREEVGSEDRGAVCVLTRALYGLKSSGASWHSTLAQHLRDTGFEDTKADPDVWRRSATKKDGTKYYELALIYVDDILVVSENPKPVMLQISEKFPIKEDSIKTPEIYLGAQVYKHPLPHGKQAWAMSSEKYVKNAVNTVQNMFKDDGNGQHLKTTAKTALPPTYRPELDSSGELSGELVSRYRQLVGILRWAVELGRLDIYIEVALLSQYLACPREGHLEALYHIFAYLRMRPVTKLVLDPTTVSLDEDAFHNPDIGTWREFYGDVEELMPAGAPEPRGKSVHIACFVDSDHAGNKVTRRSHTGIIIFVQNSPIIWYSKKQNTVESSSFGSEFVAMRTARDLIVALRYKLRMFGVPLNGPADVMCDNAGVVKNTSIPESTLSKRHNAINYHVIRESVAAGIMRVGKEDGDSNLADAFTKILPFPRRQFLFSRMLWSSSLGNEVRGEHTTRSYHVIH